MMTKLKNSTGEEFFVGIGQMVIKKAPARMSSVLRSCVVLTLYNEKSRIGGMVHILLSGGGGREDSHYSDPATRTLVEEMRKRAGEGDRIVAKIVGGSESVFKGESCLLQNIGRNTVAGIVSILVEEMIDIEGMHMGGNSERKMVFDTGTGDIEMSLMLGSGILKKTI